MISWLKKNKIYLLSIIFGATVTFVQYLTAERTSPSKVQTADTFIPYGFVLVPLELSNSEALDSVLGTHGVIDLYYNSGLRSAKTVLVARRIKILRAPLNPNKFAVLAPEIEAKKVLGYPGPFNAVVQNPKQTGTSFEKKSPRKLQHSIEEI